MTYTAWYCSSLFILFFFLSIISGCLSDGSIEAIGKHTFYVKNIELLARVNENPGFYLKRINEVQYKLQVHMGKFMLGFNDCVIKEKSEDGIVFISKNSEIPHKAREFKINSEFFAVLSANDNSMELTVRINDDFIAGGEEFNVFDIISSEKKIVLIRKKDSKVLILEKAKK